MATSPYGYTVFSSTATVSGKLPQILTDMAAQGATDLRWQINWNLIDPGANGDYTPGGVGTNLTLTGLDDAVLKATNAGINMVLCIQFPPGSASLGTGYYTQLVAGSSPATYLPDPAKTAAFAKFLATRYNGGARGLLYAIDIGNEDYDLAANSNQVRDAGGKYLANTLVASYAGIKQALPSCLVVGACLLRQDEAHIQGFLADLYTNGGFKNCDSIGMHFYKNGGTTTFPAGIPPDNAPVNFGFTQFWRKMYQTMVSLNYIKSIWLTECGYDAVSIATNGTSNTTAFYQQKYLQYELLNAMKSGIIKKFYHYTIGNNDTHSLTQHGQVDGLTETFQPAYYGFQSLIAEHPQSDWEPVKTTTKQLSLSGAATNVLVTGAATTLLLTEK